MPEAQTILRLFDNLFDAITGATRDSESFREEYHCHTTASDGILSPTELLDLFHRLDIVICAVTDHNTFNGSQLAASSRSSPVVIPGVELSASHAGMRVHVLGYFADYANPATDKVIQRIRQGHLQRESIRLSRLRSALPHLALTEDILLNAIGDRVPNWRLVATALVNAGDASTVEQASELYLQTGTVGHLSYSSDWPKVAALDAVQAITADGGLAFIAHPGDVEQRLGQTGFCLLARQMKDDGLTGFEITGAVTHSALSLSMESYLKEVGLVPIHGSDFHGGGVVRTPKSSRVHSFLGAFLAHYSQLLPEATLRLSLQETVLPVQSIRARFDACGEGSVRALHEEGVDYVKQLFAVCKTGAHQSSSPRAIVPHFVPLLWSSVAHASIELGVLSILKSMDAEQVYEFVLTNVELNNAPLLNSLAFHLATDVRYPVLELEYPLGYRLCRYEETLVSRDAAVGAVDLPHYGSFARFFGDFSGELVGEFGGFQILDQALSDAVAQLHSWGIPVEGIIRRGLKSPASAYEKFVRTWLTERPSVLSTREAGPERYGRDTLLALWPDLFAGTVVIEGEDVGQQYYSLMEARGFSSILDVVSDLAVSPRRWYHNRFYLAGLRNGVPIEILVKTRGDHWLSRFYYWMTKSGRLFLGKGSVAQQTISSDLVARLRSARSEADLYLPAWYEVIRYMADFAPEERSRECLTSASTSILSTLVNA